MTYNHDKAKVTCSDCAREVERLEVDLQEAREQIKELRSVISEIAELWDDACEG